MPVTVTRRGRVDLDVNAALDFLVTQAVGIVQRRTARGLDINGKAFEPYSPLYSMQLRSVGERDNVDLTRSGAYLAGIRELERHVDSARGIAYVTIGPGTGTSPTRHLPPPYVFDPKKTPEERAEAFADWKAAPKKPGRSPPHNQLARYLSVKRPHLGLSAEERQRLAQQMVRVLVKQGR
jgi:hypothetical protein